MYKYLAKSNGKLTKMEIRGYKESDYTGLVGKYVFSINPAQLADKNSILYSNDSTPMGANGEIAKFKRTGPKTLDIQFIADGTGVVENSDDVPTQLKKLHELAFAYNGDIHEPNYVKLFWGKRAFAGRMTAMDINYTLFDVDGKALRAEVNCSFKEHTDIDTLGKKAKKNSPDLSHLRTVKAGDTLPLMCYRIYRDSKYYLEIARINELDDFRNLTPGTQILFPPLTNI